MPDHADPQSAATPRRGLDAALAVAAVAVIGWADHITGPAYGFALLYIAPVVWAAARVGRRISLVVAGAAAATWFVDDVIDERVHLAASVWNAFTRLMIFAVLAWLVAGQRAAARRLAVLNERLRAAAEREARIARIDVVTDLPNSRAFAEALRTESARARRDGHPLCVIAVDLDNFKAVNDRYGHEQGDECLRGAGAALRAAVRQGDLAARIGGDEFAVLLWAVDATQARTVADRIVTQIGEVAVEFPDTGLGASVGIAYCTTVPEDPTEPLRLADRAMYAAKHAGKARVVEWSPTLDASA